MQKKEEQLFLAFHQILFRAQAYNRAPFLEDLAEDFLQAQQDAGVITPVEQFAIDTFLNDYSGWEKNYLQEKKTD